MKPIELIQKLKKAKVALRLNHNHDIEVIGVLKSVDRKLLELLRSHKDEVVNYLKSHVNSRFETIPSVEESDHYPLSHAQKRLWLIDQLETDSTTAYNISAAYTLRGNLSIPFLEKAFVHVINRHESLRTHFITVDWEPRQTISDLLTDEFTIDLIDLEGNSDATRVIEELIDWEETTKFNLANDLLLRIKLVKLGASDYVCILTIHHIISDGWSMEILIDEVLTSYNALLSNESVELPDLSIQYKDFSSWQHQLLASEDFNVHRQYWMEQFAQEVPVLQLPADYTRPSPRTYAGSSVNCVIDRSLTQAMKHLASQEGISLFITLLSSVYVLLYRYSGQSDIVVGTPTAGRNHHDLEGQIGLYINMLALRATFSGSESFRTLLKKVKDLTLGAYEYQSYPFDLLVEDLELKRDLSRMPLFDVMVMFQNANQGIQSSSNMPDIEVGSYEAPIKTSKFDLNFFFKEEKEHIELIITYSTDLYRADRMQRMVNHYQQLLNALLLNSDSPLFSVPYLNQEERNELLDNGRGHFVTYPRQSVADLLTERANQVPDHVAVVGDDLEVTYRELYRRSDKYGIYLVSQHELSPGDRVAVLLDRSPDLIALLIGLMNEAVVFVPIDVQYPKARIDQILDKADVKLVITQSDYLSKIDREYLAIDIVTLYNLPESNHGQPQSLPTDRSRPIYLMFTSGTTGTPKGVEIVEKGFSNYLEWCNRYYFNNTIGFNFPFFTSIAFDLTLTSIFSTLLRGDCIYIYSETLPLLDTLKSIFKNETPINAVKLTPSHVNVLSSLDKLETNVSKVIVGGEAVKNDHIKTLRSLDPNIEIFNEYGPTEATIGCMISQVQPNESTPISIGKPIANTEVYLLDEYQQLVPVGIPGELYLSGAGLSTGYFRDAELTYEKFIANPYATDCLMYQTGDRAYWNESGNIVYLGRKDSQVKLRGYRIELGEIESVVRKFKGITSVLTLLVESGGNKSLACYYQADATEVSNGELKNYLVSHLPSYMVPTYLIGLETFPLTIGGKVDKLQLPDPIESGKNKYVRPRNTMEEELVKIWKTVLGKDRIGITDNFFDLGGDSIKAIQLSSRVFKAGFKLEVRDIFQYLTIENLSEVVKPVDNEMVADQSNVSGEVLLTPIQRAFFEWKLKSPEHYNQSVLLHRAAGFSLEAIQSIFSLLQEHHDALRIRYDNKHHETIQFNESQALPLSISVHDLISHKQVEGTLNALCEEIQSSINLVEGPPMRLGLFHTNSGDYLLIVIHHLVIDGVSWRILLEDLEVLYEQYISGLKLELPLKTSSFKLWSESLVSYARSPAALSEVSYWDHILQQGKYLSGIKQDHDVSTNTIADTHYESFALDQEQTNALLSCHNAFGTEVNDLLLTAFGLSIKDVLGNDRFWVALEGHGREHIVKDIDVTRTVGWFTTIYPVLFELKAEGLARQIKEVKETLRRVPNKGIGYGILKHLNPEALCTDEPVIDICFNYLGEFATLEKSGQFVLSDKPRGANQAGNNDRQYPIEVGGIIIKGGLTITVAFSKYQYDATTVHSLLNAYKKRLVETVTLCAKTQKEITPSDLLYDKISIEQLEEIQRRLAPYEPQNMYPLSPSQEGLLYHTLSDKSSDPYFEQISYRMSGELIVGHIKSSLDELFIRYDILRTVFLFEEVELPLQVVLRNRQADFYYQDLRDVPVSSQKDRIAEFKSKDRKRSFDLGRDVLMRVAILQLDDTSYEFIWSYHHIIMDGWCLGILIPELHNIYTSHLSGKAYQLPKTQQYHHYISWLEKQDKEQSKKYWLDYLDGYTQAASFPTKNSVVVSDDTYKTLYLALGQKKSTELADLAARSQVTLNNLFEVLWGILLSRYTGSRDVVYGRVVSGRPSELEGVERMVGLFINTIPVRIRYEEDQEFASLLRQVQEASVEGHRYHYHSLAEIQATTELGNHLINHILVFQNYPLEKRLSNSGEKENTVEVSEVSIFEQTNYDLGVVITPGEDTEISFTYNSCIYDGWMVEQVWAHFVFLIDQVLEDAHLPIRDLRWLTPQDEQLLETFNGPWVDYPQDQTMVSLFEAQSARTSEGIALVYEDRAWSYAELNARSNQLAHYLRDRYAIQADDLLGLSMRRSDWMIVSILGILKSGAGYVPIDVGYPLARQQYMVNDSGMKGLLTDGPVSEGLEELVSWVDVRQLGWEGYSQENPERIAGPQDIAYVIYTSGTTGYPKGTPILHSSNVNMSLSQVQQFRLTPSDRVAQFASISFDASVYEIFMNFYAGAGLVVFSEDHLREPRQFLRYLRAQGVSVVTLPPAYLSTLPVEDLGFLRVIITAGESADVFQASYLSGQVEYYNAYGPTECAVCVTTYQVQPEDRDRRRIPIGRPIANMRVDIMDEQLRRVPVGVPGEICVSGVGLSPGYLGQAALTATRFVSDSSVVGGRLYRTGDVGRWDREGYIEYLGRMDDQIKLRGYRIELGEIEQVLGIHPEVGGSVVVVSGEGEQRYLTGYYTSPSGVGTEELRVYLSHSLPAYMVPTYLIRLDSFPLTASGKIDKKQLPHPVDMAEGAQCYTAPQTPLQQQLVAIWEALLGHSPVGIDDNFFELGGHSLRAIRLVSRLGRDIGKSVGVGEIFRHPTIRMLSERLAGEPTVVTAAIPRAGEASSYPLSHAQQRLWLIEQLEGESVAYNIFGVYKLRGEVSMVGMAEAFRRVVDRHESLRTRLITEEGAPRQQVVSVDEIGYQFDYQDLRSMTDAEQVLQQLVEEEGSSRFDLGTGPLLRTKLVRLGEEQYYFLLSLHHIIADGWSMEVLVREVLQYYQGYIEGQGVELPPLAIQYKDYAVWQRQALQETSYQSARRYWLEQLGGGLPMLELPTDYRRGEVRSQRGATVSYDLDRELYERIRRLSQQAGTSLFMTLLSGVKVLLYRYTGQGDMVVGSPIAGRDHYALEDQIGFYVNTLVLRTQLGGENTFWQVLQQVKERTLEAYVHQHYPFDQLVQELGAGRDRSRTPLFDVMVVLQNGDMSGEEFPGLEVDSYPVESGVSKFDLTFTFYEGGEGLQLSVNYNTDLYQEERIERLMGHYAELMRSVTEQVHEKINKIDYLGEAERVQLLETFNGPWVDYPQDQTMVSLFEAQSARTSEGIALVYEDRAWSYAELNARSNQLAHYLRDRYAIQADDLLGLSMRRSDWMIVSILGILKSGAGYVPIDVGYPLARQQYMVNDSGMKGLLTDGPVSEGLEELVSWVDVRQLGWEGYSQENPERIAGPQDIAYVIYTSGSTGQPKACLIEHTGVVNMSLALIKRFLITSEDRFLQFASVSFDASVYEIFMTFNAGATLVLMNEEDFIDADQFVSFLTYNTVNVVALPPSYLSTLQDHKLDFLKTIISGGEATNVKQATVLCQSSNYFNAYGPTECSVCVSTYKVEVSDQQIIQIPIGRPIANMQLYVLDGQEQLVPIGVMGEICIAGVGVSRGYLHQEELSRAKFRKNPYPGGETLYHSGDLGYWDEAGQLVYVGRIDEQVKLRGYRIEPGEVAMMMEQHPEVRTAVVTIGAHAAQQNLVGYYQASSVIEEEELRGYLSEQLPGYMVPTYLIRLDSFPLTASGKIDKKQLPDPVGMGLGQREYVAPQSEVEKVVVRVWEEVLGRQGIGLQDNFFELGGDSIKAIQLCSRLFRQGYKLEVKDIFRHLTIAGVSSVAQPAISCQPIDQGVVVGEVLLTPIQQAFFSWGLKAAHHYNQAQLLYRQQGFDPEAIRAVFKQLQTHHDALRMTYSRQQGHWRQWNEDATHPLALFIYDLREAKDAVGQLTELGTQLQSGMNLESGPLLQLGLFHMPDGDRLLIAIHHLVVDGVSWRILLEDIAILLQQYHQGEVLELSAKTSSFQQWSASLHRYSQSEAFKQEFSYWESVEAEGAQVERLRKDDGGVSLGRVGASRQVSFQLSEEETISLLTRCHQAFGTEINDLLLTGLGMGLFEVFGGQKVLLMLEGHGREGVVGGVDVTRTVGWFTSMYPVVLDMGYGQELGRQIKEVKERLRKVPHKGIGYGLYKYHKRQLTVGEWLGAEMSFNYLGQYEGGMLEGGQFGLASESGGASQSVENQRQFAIDITGLVLNGKLGISIVYDPLKYNTADIHSLQKTYHTSLERIIRLCANAKKELTPSDFTYRNLSVQELEDFFE